MGAMWRRLRRKTMDPSRPVLHPSQYALALVTFGLLAIGIYKALDIL